MVSSHSQLSHLSVKARCGAPVGLAGFHSFRPSDSDGLHSAGWRRLFVGFLIQSLSQLVTLPLLSS